MMGALIFIAVLRLQITNANLIVNCNTMPVQRNPPQSLLHLQKQTAARRSSSFMWTKDRTDAEILENVFEAVGLGNDNRSYPHHIAVPDVFGENADETYLCVNNSNLNEKTSSVHPGMKIRFYEQTVFFLDNGDSGTVHIQTVDREEAKGSKQPPRLRWWMDVLSETGSVEDLSLTITKKRWPNPESVGSFITDYMFHVENSPKLMETHEAIDTRIALRIDDGSGLFIFNQGCKPGVSIRFNPLKSGMQTVGENCSPIPCLFSADYMTPVLEWVDDFNDEVTMIEFVYSLRIIGGGPSADMIRRYTPKELNKYRSAGDQKILAHSIDSPDYQLDLLDTAVPDSLLVSNSSRLTWACASGSPCNKVIPQTILGPARYFFEFEARLLTIEEYRRSAELRARNSIPTFCKKSTTFTAAIRGFQMDWVVIVVFLCCVTGICFLILLLMYLWQRSEYMLSWVFIRFHKQKMKMDTANKRTQSDSFRKLDSNLSRISRPSGRQREETEDFEDTVS